MQLAPAGTRIGIAEGIETALAASRLFALPFWAATSAALLEKWKPPPVARQIVIAADNDHSFVGQAAAFSLAKGLVRDGYDVTVSIPKKPGDDWADVRSRSMLLQVV